jgi:3-deoxy-D-manno-octulosonic-acid transferase
LLTFFSPSGYEIRKNYPGADYIFYLPADTYRNARKFIRLVDPKVVIFVKYEYWFNYIRVLKKKGTPLIFISAIFRPGQRFFTWWGKWQLKGLKLADHFFVQNQQSAHLLVSVGISDVTISGDTRFDRVAQVAQQKKAFPLVEIFKGENKIFLAGSTWPPDEEIITGLIRKNIPGLKFIFATHEVHNERIEALLKMLPGNPVKFSDASENNIHKANILIIDSIGILSHLYQYAEIAYIGGGFGVGIHNILEAATFGKPVIFGPNYQKFQEARELLDLGGAFSISDQRGFLEITEKLLENEDFLRKASQASKDYVADKTGATRMILEYLGEEILGR